MYAIESQNVALFNDLGGGSSCDLNFALTKDEHLFPIMMIAITGK
jgi:hypothetical protein